MFVVVYLTSARGSWFKLLLACFVRNVLDNICQWCRKDKNGKPKNLILKLLI